MSASSPVQIQVSTYVGSTTQIAPYVETPAPTTTIAVASSTPVARGETTDTSSAAAAPAASTASAQPAATQTPAAPSDLDTTSNLSSPTFTSAAAQAIQSSAAPAAAASTASSASTSGATTLAANFPPPANSTLQNDFSVTEPPVQTNSAPASGGAQPNYLPLDVVLIIAALCIGLLGLYASTMPRRRVSRQA